MKSTILLILFAFLAATGLNADPNTEDENPVSTQVTTQNDPIKIELISEDENIHPGQTLWVALRLTMDDNWHSYWKNPGDVGMPTAIEWELPPGFTAGPTEWPYPQRFDLESLVGYGYEGEVWLLTPIYPSHAIDQNASVQIKANIRWLVCSDTTCVPGKTQSSIELPVTPSLPNHRKEWASSFLEARAQLPKKQWGIRAQKKEGLIELHLEAPSHHAASYTEAEFFPEHKRMIDQKTPSVFVTYKERPGTYTVILHDYEATDTKQKTLKGVIVLQGSKKGHSHYKALEVHAPIEDYMTEDTDALSTAAIDKPNTSTYGELEILPPVEEFEGGFGLALLLAFIGGMILNLMPCVLPVISFKILSFVKMANQSRSTTLKHGLAFSGGVIVSFWILAGALLILQTYGQSVGWGFQLQEPLFVALLAAILLIFGLSLFGVFELGISVTAAASDAQAKKQSGYAGSFFSGILATAVATPCTGPFLGSAVGFAVTLPPLMAMTIFTSLGLGMALPYLLLSANPQLMRFLPKPGPWMEVFKELMGFVMLATVIWLVWVFSAQTSTLAVILLLGSFFFFAIGCWIFGKWGTPVKSRITRSVSYVLTLIFFSMATYAIAMTQSQWVTALEASSRASSHHEKTIWEPFSEEKIAALRQKGIPVFVDFTAKWCLICQTNHLVLSTHEVSTKFDEHGVVRMKADWTKNDDAITKALRKFGRNGVPLYVLYGPDASKPPVILPQVLTPDIVLDQLHETLNAGHNQKGAA